MSNPVLSLRQVSRDYEQGGAVLHVLRNLSLDINPGEVVALVGPSGSGKSTLLHIAGLLDKPTSGEVLIQGEVVSNASDKKRTAARRSHIGFVYQFHHLLPEFSALENIVLPQMMAGVDKATASQKALQVLGELGLAARSAHRPGALSGGEQQRVAIGRALANSPALLLADEPTGNLDAATAEDVFALLLRQVRERKLAALVATHNPDLARRMDRIVQIEGAMLKTL